MSDALKDTLTVECGSEKFEFKLPSPRDLARISTRAETLRRKDDPGSAPTEDGFTWMLYRGFALLETLSFQADCEDNWPFSENPADPGKLIVDSSKFPPGTEFKVTEVYRAFNDALTAFHEKRTGSKQPATAEAVAG